ncbi:diadenylate cyclase CdaA [bacterium]|nr:diadenylate cyclase CdaA [bacterium]MCB9476404.1 TIGR00159 family protein [Deltaproteobacteria bacterium]MCB9478379.1 TIGR00159 family protein [Deltaproteobacteria bacterium]
MNELIDLLTRMNWRDGVDVFCVTVVIYNIIMLVRRTRAVQMMLGLGLIFVVYVVSEVASLHTLHWMLDTFLQSAIILVVILFAEDIRRGLGRIGKNPFATSTYVVSAEFLDEVVRSIQALINRRIGAIIVIERETGLNEYIDEGVPLDAAVSRELLISIFLPSSPIHDGAVIIRKGRIVSAGCFFPLAMDITLDKNLGTRHRAAIGVSQSSDAAVLVVSEERGEVGLAYLGELEQNLSPDDLYDRLGKLLS